MVFYIVNFFQEIQNFLIYRESLGQYRNYYYIDFCSGFVFYYFLFFFCLQFSYYYYIDYVYCMFYYYDKVGGNFDLEYVF